MDYCEENTLSEQDYCFAYAHLESFYSRHHFVKISPQELPIA